MCEHCMNFPHHSRCPNAPEEESSQMCNKCSEGIYEGEEYFIDPSGVLLCEGCVDAMTVRETLFYFGCERKTAEVAA